MGLAEDIDILFTEGSSTALFGLEDVEILFEEPFDSTDIYSGAVFNTAPACLIRSADIATHGIECGTILTIGDTDYSVNSIQPAGPGLTRLIFTTDF